jgi:hypothetical protein
MEKAAPGSQASRLRSLAALPGTGPAASIAQVIGKPDKD